VAFGVAGIAWGVAGGVAMAISFWTGYYRVLFYWFEALWSFWVSQREAGLRFSPVSWDELIWLPLPGLDRQLVAIARRDRAQGLAAIGQVAASFRQGWAARAALLELLAEDIRSTRSLEQIACAQETLAWAPEDARTELKNFWDGLEQIAQSARSAQETDTLYNRQEQLRRGLEQTTAVRRGLAFAPDARLARKLNPALETWEIIFNQELQAANQREFIPNVYVAGSPLLTASKVFKGRQDVFIALENELASPAEQRPALLLFGARRTGKTSVLRQLPARLGSQVIPCEIDLQRLSTAESAAGLLGQISVEIHRQAYTHRKLELPAPPVQASNSVSIPWRPISFALPAPPVQALTQEAYLSFNAWLQEVEAALGDRWLLLNFDEYEALDSMVQTGCLDERIYPFLRGLIQHSQRVVLLFSGAHTLEDLPPVWSHHLVNVRLIPIGALQENEARDLITRPIPNFPVVYAPGMVEHILALSGRQPYLIQMLCRDLVNHLNGEKRMQAQPADLDVAQRTALTGASGYFDDQWRGPDSDEAQRSVLAALAGSTEGRLERSTLQTQSTLDATAFTRALRRLERRALLTTQNGQCSYTAGLFRLWVQERL